jgi:mRNA interferase RelE/StbE
MKVEFLHHFNKDLEKINDRSVKNKITGLINLIEKSKSVYDIPNVKKLTGFRSAYRIRMGNYRIGVFVESGIVELARIAHRKDIYKIFP